MWPLPVWEASFPKQLCTCIFFTTNDYGYKKKCKGSYVTSLLLLPGKYSGLGSDGNISWQDFGWDEGNWRLSGWNVRTCWVLNYRSWRTGEEDREWMYSGWRELTGTVSAERFWACQLWVALYWRFCNTNDIKGLKCLLEWHSFCKPFNIKKKKVAFVLYLNRIPSPL